MKAIIFCCLCGLFMLFWAWVIADYCDVPEPAIIVHTVNPNVTP
jgi:hypothetical protein